jgi:hypothetical protein
MPNQSKRAALYTPKAVKATQHSANISANIKLVLPAPLSVKRSYLETDHGGFHFFAET